MQRQVEMENTMLAAHREFITNLANSIDMHAADISEAAEMSQICTDEWCHKKII